MKLVKEISKRKLRYVGLCNKTQQNISNGISPTGKDRRKKKKGSPSVSYLSNLRDITNMDVGLMTGNIRDRDKWRKIVNSVAATIGPGDADE